jgi:hypothetical protein
MDVRSFIRPIIAGLVGLGIVVLLIVLIVKLFTRPSAPRLIPVDVGIYAHSSAEATLVMQGPTVIDQDFRQVKITVSQNQNEIELIEGYQGHVAESKTYQSNSAAFGAFLQSLKLQGFSRGTSRNLGDYRGFCPTGSRYLYGFNDGNTDLFNYWSTSCGSEGTFKGTPRAVRGLFIRQIPEQDFNDILSGTSITF